ncbi:MAG: glucose-6-phosphate isomerase [Streptococcaceae bacterium]|jgi:glucose-6-phosphate isomerase|nr:glucose-6-phosphate isomerase [Streptococcaceae bacterium]
MLKELKKSGLPIYQNQETGLLAMEAPLIDQSYAAKKLSQMENLFDDDSSEDKNEHIYDVYRGIEFPKDSKQLRNDNFQYDITVVKTGTVGKERKKTSGHYHSWNEMHTSTYPEVYEVISGTALYILQRADNFEDKDYENLAVEDVIVVRVHEGQTLIVPPNYAHCSVNGGDKDLVFSNLAITLCKVDYAPVKYYHGLAVYVEEDQGKLVYKTNEHYKELPKIKFAEVRENPELGITFNEAIYQSYVENPAAFDFLKNVDNYTADIMNMLVYKEKLE